MDDDTVALTGIKPTGRPHLGNYLGMIEPCLELAQGHQTYCFIADYHALTTVRDAQHLANLIDEAAASLLAFGLNPHQTVFYRQSAVPEILELMWILSCTAAKGIFNRAHAYKAAVDQNRMAGRDTDADIQMGLFNYPLLMAADILAFGAKVVPVGPDQKQHVEIARDVAGSFHKAFGRLFQMPDALIADRTETVPGIDGRKMSKSYGNEIPVLASPEELRRRIMRIVTDSRKPGDPKNPDRCTLFNLYRRLAPSQDREVIRQRYLEGGLAYKEMKETLIGLLEDRFAEARDCFADHMAHPGELADILHQGAQKARTMARQTLDRVKSAVGITAT